jgi:predicted nucleotidyltransferase
MSNPLDKAIETIIQVADPDKIILFGSRSRGEHREGESDYDLLVLKKGVKKQRKLAQKIYLNFKDIGAPVDVIVVDPEKYERLKANPYMIYIEADKNGTVVYERS